MKFTLSQLLLVLLLLMILPGITNAQSMGTPAIGTPEEIGKTVLIRNVTFRNNVVSGEVVNLTPHSLRDVEVLVEYHWLWKNEFKPGRNPPGVAAFVKLHKDIPPRQSVTFTYAPEMPMEMEKDGHFMHEVSVAAFTVYALPGNMSVGSR